MLNEKYCVAYIMIIIATILEIVVIVMIYTINIIIIMFTAV